MSVEANANMANEKSLKESLLAASPFLIKVVEIVSIFNEKTKPCVFGTRRDGTPATNFNCRGCGRRRAWCDFFEILVENLPWRIIERQTIDLYYTHAGYILKKQISEVL